MSNLEELDKRNETLIEKMTLFKEDAKYLDSNDVNLTSLNFLFSTYLPAIAKSLAIIADKMSEKDKEEVNDNRCGNK